MQLQEIKQDLFRMPEEVYLAHCISADAKMGAGIAVQFCRRFKLADLQARAGRNELEVGGCYLEGRVLNLVTKPKYWHKPTYETMASSLAAMKRICMEKSITRLAMPEIGCGLDKLQWGRVRELLTEACADMEIEITVCRL